MDPHSPYLLRSKSDDPENPQIVRSYDSLDPDATLEDLSEAYDSEVEYADYYIGKIFELMKSRQLLDKTLVVFLSDHGEAFGEHNVPIVLQNATVRGRHHGHSMYNELLHVPLILRYPASIPAAERVAQPVRLVDVLPTMLSLTGIETGLPEGTFRGRSLTPLIQHPGEHTDAPLCYSERLYFGEERRALQDDRYKLITKADGTPLELYDLGADPRETTNLIAADPSGAQYLEQDMSRLTAKLGPLIPKGQTGRKKELTLKERDRLKSLGYVH